MEQDEIYLVDLWRILAREWRWIVGTLVLAIAGAVFLAHAAHPQWEATAWIRPGQLGLVPSGEDPRAEPFQRVIDRMKTVTFQDAVLHDLGLDPRTREAQLYRKSFKLDPSPYAGLIKLNVRGYSPQQAARLADATFRHLRAIHDGIMAEPLRWAAARQRQTQAQLAEATAERDHLLQAIAPQPAQAAGEKGAPGVMLASVVLNESNREIRGLQQQTSDLKARLDPFYSYGTSLAWPIYVPDKRAYPNPVLILGAGLVLGLGLGVMLAIARHARRRAAAR